MRKTFPFIAVSFLLTLASCEERSPAIRILAPENGQAFSSGQMIEVKAKITDSDAIQAESLIVTNESNDTVFNFEEHEFRGQSHIFSKSFEASTQGSYRIEVGGFGHSSWTFKSITVYVD